MNNTVSLTASTDTAHTHLQSIDLSGVQAAAKAAASPVHASVHALLSATAPGGGSQKKGIDSANTSPLSKNNRNIKNGVEQFLLAAGQIVAFDRDVTTARRRATVQSVLLTQLAAQSRYPRPDTIEQVRTWQAIYVQTLTHIGWVPQSGQVYKNSTGSINIEIDKALIVLLEELLPDGTAVAIAKKVINTLDSPDSSSPLITVFQERTVEQKSVDFSISLSKQKNAGSLVRVIDYVFWIIIMMTSYQRDNDRTDCQ